MLMAFLFWDIYIYHGGGSLCHGYNAQSELVLAWCA